ncbi:MAG: hypothetical protein EOP33_05810 [Rickettsiaceae bacterium]|nr:MAG: hypothetical protein EOP33_05810 [Rickettsiaceae bacterium]
MTLFAHSSRFVFFFFLVFLFLVSGVFVKKHQKQERETPKRKNRKCDRNYKKTGNALKKKSETDKLSAKSF